MFELKIEGKSWPEVTKQLAELIGEKQESANDKELIVLRNQLTDAFNTIEEKNARIAELEQQLAKADKEVGLARKKCAKQADEIAELKAKLEAPDENPTIETAAKPASEQTATASDTEPDPATDQSTTSEPEQPKYDKAQVREFLAEARNKGVNITDVLKPFGGRFPAVKEEDYPALMEATKKALAEKGAK